MRSLILPALAASLMIAATAGAARAQLPNVPNSSQPTTGPLPFGTPPKQPAAKIAPPPALPGASSNSGNVAPATHTPSDMEPTDALFDAINRGDISAARDAISRGADLSGHNILGMTPLDLSIDLGRNDISFLLLSMRGGDTSRQATANNAPAKQTTVKDAKRTSTRTASVPATKVAVTRPAPTQTARLFSGDGGTPIPNAGFLGFDSAHH